MVLVVMVVSGGGGCSSGGDIGDWGGRNRYYIDFKQITKLP